MNSVKNRESDDVPQNPGLHGPHHSIWHVLPHSRTSSQFGDRRQERIYGSRLPVFAPPLTTKPCRSPTEPHWTPTEPLPKPYRNPAGPPPPSAYETPPELLATDKKNANGTKWKPTPCVSCVFWDIFRVFSKIFRFSLMLIWVVCLCRLDTLPPDPPDPPLRVTAQISRFFLPSPSPGQKNKHEKHKTAWFFFCLGFRFFCPHGFSVPFVLCRPDYIFFTCPNRRLLILSRFRDCLSCCHWTLELEPWTDEHSGQKCNCITKLKCASNTNQHRCLPHCTRCCFHF